MNAQALMLKTLVALTALFCLVSTPAKADLPPIQISGANFRPLPMAIAVPLTTDVPRAVVDDFDGALSFDLGASGLFQVLDRKSFLASPTEGFTADRIQFNRWADTGAEALVKTQLTSDGPSVRVEARLFGVGSKREELKVSQSGSPKDVRRLAHGLADALFRQFTGEPGPFRSKLVFVHRGEKDRDVWLADWDGLNGQRLTSGGINLLPALASDGQTVGYTSYRKGKPDLYVQKVGAAALALVQNGQMATGISFSPDGRRIAYSLSKGESAQIWVARADGSEARPLTDSPFFINTSPCWSPDGRRIAFVSNRGGSPQIYVMSAEGRDVRRLTFQGNYNQTPDWSPRGDLIAFTARDERNVFDLFTVNVETGKITRLTQSAGNNEEPSFAPNGRLIVFSSTRTGSPQLFVMTAQGENQKMLPSGEGARLTPDWGPLTRE